MTKNHGKKNSSSHSNSFSRQLLLVSVCLLVGYLSAKVFDFSSISQWVNAQWVARQGPSISAKPEQRQAQLPKPKFEFYTLLSSEQKDASEQIETKESGNPSPQSPTGGAVAQALPPPTSPVITEHPPMVSKTQTVGAVAEKQVTSVAPATIRKGAFLVQVAAFRSQQEAERMKAVLVLKGFEVNIVVVNQQKNNWYRVNLGPFVSRADAKRAQEAVARSEHIVGMVRKMDA